MTAEFPDSVMYQAIRLPKPDAAGDQGWLWDVDGDQIEAENQVHGSPTVWFNDGPRTPGQARLVAGALLAAADRAEQLAGEVSRG